MNTIKIRKNNTLIIAHRGLSGLEKENTACAFIAAGVKGYYACECDIHKTKDGKWVICHDDNLNRVGGVDVKIKDYNYKELLNFKLIDNFTGNKKDYLQIVSLEDYINICKKYNMHCVIEYKEDFDKNDVLDVINKIKELDYLDNVIFISFYPNTLIYTKEVLPLQRAQLLISSYSDEVFSFCNKYNIGIDAHYAIITKDIIDKWHCINQSVNAWTVNDKKIANKLIKNNIDFITSDILE